MGDLGQAAEDSDKSSMSQSIFNLVKNVMGAGMLSLPSGVAAFSDTRCSRVPDGFLDALCSESLSCCYAQ